MSSPSRVSNPLPSPFIDPLSAVLDGTRLRFVMPSAHHMGAPWGIDFVAVSVSQMRKHVASLALDPPRADPPTMRGSIIAVVRGSCCLEVPDHQIKLAVSSGDVVIINREVAFTMRDDWRTPAKSILQLLRREHIERLSGIHGGGAGAVTTFFTGKFMAEDDQDSLLLSVLPPVLCIRGSDVNQSTWMEPTVMFLDSELSVRAPGSQNVVDHLAHVLFVQAVRSHVSNLPDDSAKSWIRGMFDPELAAVLALMHSRLGEQWTVASLAEEASVGRSSFAERFTAVVGQPPLQYLTECRMRRARELLRNSQLGIKTIATRVGYTNESAFSAAFRRRVGVAPGAYRNRPSLQRSDGAMPCRVSKV